MRNAPGPSESIGSNMIGGVVEGVESVVWVGPAKWICTVAPTATTIGERTRASSNKAVHVNLSPPLCAFVYVNKDFG